MEMPTHPCNQGRRSVDEHAVLFVVVGLRTLPGPRSLLGEHVPAPIAESWAAQDGIAGGAEHAGLDLAVATGTEKPAGAACSFYGVELTTHCPRDGFAEQLFAARAGDVAQASHVPTAFATEGSAGLAHHRKVRSWLRVRWSPRWYSVPHRCTWPHAVRRH